MLNSLFDTVSMKAARTALSGLSRRQEAVAGNIANIDTVGYQRRSVNFEDALSSRLRPSAGVMQTSDPRHISQADATGGTQSSIETRDVVSSRNDQNNVSIDEEMMLMVETQLRYQALTQTLGRRIGTLRAVIRG